MATVALTIIGAAVGTVLTGGAAAPALFTVAGYAITGAAIGAAVGAAAGGIIDRQYVYPAIFGSGAAAQSGPRLDSVSVQTASEGSHMRVYMGPENRGAGVVHWFPPLKEVRSSQRVGKGKRNTNYTYYANCAIGLSDTPFGPMSKLRGILAEGQLLWSRDENDVITVDPRIKAVRFYNGTQTLADPLIEAVEGDAPAFIKTCYVVLEDFAVADWGNRLPNLNFLIEADAYLNLSEALRRLTEWSGKVVANTSSLYGEVTGYAFQTPCTSIAVLEPIMLAYDLDVREEDGEIIFFRKGYEDEVTVPINDTGAHEGDSDDYSRWVKAVDLSRIERPWKVNIKYFDPELNYEIGMQSARRQAAVDSKQEIILEVPLTLTKNQAQKIAKRILWQAWANSPCTMTLPPKYVGLQEADVINTFTPAGKFRLKIESITRGNNGLLEIDGRRFDPRIHRSLAITGDLAVDPGTVYVPPDTVFYAFDNVAVSDEVMETPGVYMAMAPEIFAAPWRGGTAYHSADDFSYYQGSTHSNQSTMGETASVLGIPATLWQKDDEAYVDVRLLYGSLSSVTRKELLTSNVNRCFIGNEYLAFQRAQLIGTRTYRLSGLVRGLKSSSHFYELGGSNPLGVSHIIGTKFCLVTEDDLQFIQLTNANIGSPHYFKGVPVGQDISSIVKQTIGFVSYTQKQLPPSRPRVRRSGSDVLLTWARRSRGLTSLFGAYQPIGFDSEKYEIEFSNGRTASVTSPSFLYTAAMISADGTTANAFSAYVYQIGATGRGKGRFISGSML